MFLLPSFQTADVQCRRVQSNRQGVADELLDYRLASHISPMMPTNTRRLHTWNSCLACADVQSGADEHRLVRWTNGCDCGLFGLWYCCVDERVDIVIGIATAPEPAGL